MEENKKLSEVLEGYDIEVIGDTRTFNLIGEITEDTVVEFAKFKDNLSELESPITINIHSPGGCALSMLAIIGMMEEFTETKGIVTGTCYSAALGIFASCHKREMKKYAEIMFHTCIYAYEGSLNEHKTQIKLAQKLQDKYEDIIMNGSNLAKKDFKRSKDWYFEKDYAIEIGLVNSY